MKIKLDFSSMSNLEVSARRNHHFFSQKIFTNIQDMQNLGTLQINKTQDLILTILERLKFNV